ncbi:MAG: dTDP-4-dehydrorhamnose 3,5-epimerase family protein [Thermodesulfobacteriota bacterium]
MAEPDRVEVPRLLEGGLHVDDRGSVAFVNPFDFRGVKRCYLVSNHRQGFVRAWHGHRRESKYVTAVHGAAIVCAVAIDDWEHPSKDAVVHRYVLSEAKPAVLYIPAGYANGSMSLTRDAKLMFFSTSSLEESLGDDIRFDSRYWNPWEVEER